MSESTEQRPEASEAKLKIAGFCAYQERSHSEVTEKLYSYGLFKNEVDELVAWLITENYLNEERFAKAFAGGKFRIKKWGRLKIRQALQQRHVSEYSIDKGLKEISEVDYQQTIDQLILKLSENQKTEDIFVIRNRISKHIIAKGFEPDLVWSRLRTILPD